MCSFCKRARLFVLLRMSCLAGQADMKQGKRCSVCSLLRYSQPMRNRFLLTQLLVWTMLTCGCATEDTVNTEHAEIWIKAFGTNIYLNMLNRQVPILFTQMSPLDSGSELIFSAKLIDYCWPTNSSPVSDPELGLKQQTGLHIGSTNSQTCFSDLRKASVEALNLLSILKEWARQMLWAQSATEAFKSRTIHRIAVHLKAN